MKPNRSPIRLAAEKQVADLNVILREIRPELTVATLGSYPVVRWSTATPAHSFESVISDWSEGRFVELTARDSFDERLAEFLLDQLAEVDLAILHPDKIKVLRAVFPERWLFKAIVLVPPAIAKRFEHESETLQRVTYWAVPAFDGEFADLADGSTFWHQLYRKDGWRSVVVNWNRSRKLQPDFDA